MGSITESIFQMAGLLTGNPLLFYHQMNNNNTHIKQSSINTGKTSKDANNILNTNEIMAHNPTKIDLMYKKIISGGTSGVVIDGICDTTNAKIFSKDMSVEYKFNDTKNVSLLFGTCNYFKAGSYTAVYIVNKPNDSTDYILRVTTIDSDILFDIKTYNENKKLGIRNNLPDYLYYGILTANDIKYNYSIVRIYKVIDDLKNESIDNRKLFFKKLLELLALLESKGHLINDLKPDNLGYDDKFNPVIIDYDATTVSKIVADVQTFWCSKITYTGSKQMIDGVVSFIFALFFDGVFWTEPWHVEGCHSRYTCGIIEAKNELIKKPDVDQEYFDFLKNLIIIDSEKGMWSNNPPTFNEILQLYTSKY